MSPSLPRPLLAALTLLVVAGAPASAQRRAPSDRYDDVFRKYSKRFFGPTFDWHYFKAQGLAESGLDPNARSYVGARGIMQLMPSTYQRIQSARPEFGSINDPEWNIAAGIMHDRYLWLLWKEHQSHDERASFMFGSYNAGEGPIKRAQRLALAERLDHRTWESIESVAPRIQRWRYRETLGYVRKIRRTHADLRKSGRQRFSATVKTDSAAATQR